MIPRPKTIRACGKSECSNSALTSRVSPARSRTTPLHNNSRLDVFTESPLSPWAKSRIPGLPAEGPALRSPAGDGMEDGARRDAECGPQGNPHCYIPQGDADSGADRDSENDAHSHCRSPAASFCGRRWLRIHEHIPSRSESLTVCESYLNASGLAVGDRGILILCSQTLSTGAVDHHLQRSRGCLARRMR